MLPFFAQVVEPCKHSTKLPQAFLFEGFISLTIYSSILWQQLLQIAKVDAKTFKLSLEILFVQYDHYRKSAICRVPRLCRVYFIGHSANTVFAECQIKYTRQTKTHGKIRLCRVFFSGTRQRCILPSAFVLALGKEAFCRVHFFCPRQIIFSKQFLRP